MEQNQDLKRSEYTYAGIYNINIGFAIDNSPDSTVNLFYYEKKKEVLGMLIFSRSFIRNYICSTYVYLRYSSGNRNYAWTNLFQPLVFVILDSCYFRSNINLIINYRDNYKTAVKEG